MLNGNKKLLLTVAVLLLSIGVQAKVLFPKDYADEEGKDSRILGSGRWTLNLSPSSK